MNVNLFQFCGMKGIFCWIFFLIAICGIAIQPLVESEPNTSCSTPVVCGDEQISQYLPMLKNRRVAIVANHTAMINGVHLVDTLLRLQVQVVKVFAPEHGFRGSVPAGEKINHEIDVKTGLEIVSLYGKHEAPDSIDLANVDVVLFDIQDVGARFYTYLTTMNYVMESCNRLNKRMIILDRPNPNGYYMDGTLLDMQFSSMVGALPIPIVHGCTLGELSKMIIGEKWISGKIDASLFHVIPCLNYTHNMVYSVPIPPSPNLASDCAIMCYPSLCLFEGTNVSVGRGTDSPFTCYGFPGMKHGNFKFKPKTIAGKVNHPLYEGKVCKGLDLRDQCGTRSSALNLSFLIAVYKEKGVSMFSSPSFFDKLAGTDQLRKDICSGKSEKEIKEKWKLGLEKYSVIRKMYLLYP